MTTLITIPSCTALHLPTSTSAPLPLATGDLSLILIPANPPNHPSATVTLSVGASAFPLLPISPVQRLKAKQEHPTYQFTPVPADGSAAIGQVRIQMKDSKNQGEWEATEQLCRALEAELKVHGVWDEKILYVNDEHETAGTPIKGGWGEMMATSIIGGATALAEKITTFTSQHIPSEPTTNPVSTKVETAAKVASVRDSTATLADKADVGSQKVGQTIHEAGKSLGQQLPDSIAQKAQPVPEGEKTEARKMAEEAWQEATIAAKGLAEGATTVGKAISENAHKAIQQNYGRQADQVAQDVGQSGANIAAAGASAFKATSVVIQGANAGSGVQASQTK